MKLLRRVLLVLGVAAGLVLLAPSLAAEGLYRYALHELGAPPPTPPDGPPSLSETAFWLGAGEQLPFEVEPLSASHTGWALAFDRGALRAHPPGERMASLAARVWLAERPESTRTRRTLQAWAAQVWVSRHWSAAQLTRAWMDGAWYGRGARGLDAAAATYFGKAPGALAVHETALLVALTRYPSHFDPWCSPARARGARDGVLNALARAGAITASQHEAARTAPLGVVRRPCR